MGKFSGVLLATDFDDTLYNSALKVSAENAAAIHYFTREGGYFTVATGRAHRTFTPHIHETPVNAPVILANGALLYDYEKDETVRAWDLPATAAADLRQLSADLPAVGVETYHGDEVYVYHPNEFTARHARRVQVDIPEKDILDMELPWSKAVLQGEYPALLEAQAYILERWGHRYEAIFSNPALLECTAKGATKGGMVLELARILGVERQNIYCVGDNQNDLPMLAVSAIPFAPANCAQAVKDWGAEIISSCDEHCIAEIISILDKRY